MSKFNKPKTTAQVSDAEIERVIQGADAVDDRAGVQAAGHGEGVELVEVGHPHREVGVGEQLDRLGLGRIGEQDRHVPGNRALGRRIDAPILDTPCCRREVGARRDLSTDSVLKSY